MKKKLKKTYPSGEKNLLKKIPVQNFFENWILFRGGMDLKLLFKTLLKPNCLIRDTASQTFKNLKFRRKFGHFR